MSLYRDYESEVIFPEQVKSLFSYGHLRIGCRLYLEEPFVLVEDDPGWNDNVTVVERVLVGP